MVRPSDSSSGILLGKKDSDHSFPPMLEMQIVASLSSMLAPGELLKVSTNGKILSDKPGGKMDSFILLLTK